MLRKLPFPFENQMSRNQVIAGLIYFPIHVFLLPLLLPGLLTALGMEDDTGKLNLVYYCISLAAVMVIFRSYLRRQFDVLLDRLGHCVLSFFMALGLDYILSYGLILLLMALGAVEENPNNAAISQAALEGGGIIRAVAIFMGPIVEEVLFRGVIFGGVREKSRPGAYVLTVIMFSLMHVWQYIPAGGDWTVLIYALDYIPLGIVLCWVYERSGTIWLPIGFHMMINAMSLAAMELL